MKFDFLCKTILNEESPLGTQSDMNELDELGSGQEDIAISPADMDSSGESALDSLDDDIAPEYPSTYEDKVNFLMNTGKFDSKSAPKLAAQDEIFKTFWDLYQEKNQNTRVMDELPADLESELPSTDDIADIKPALKDKETLNRQELEDIEIPDDNNF